MLCSPFVPRTPRRWLIQEGLAVHKVWRGHNREWNLKTDGEKEAYGQMLNEELDKEKDENPFHGGTFMSNHSHEVYLLTHLKKFSDFMRRHHGRYGLFFNRKHRRRGKVAQDRPFTASIEPTAAEEMRTLFYVHANPLRAHMVKDAKDYRWSTHRLYAFGKREKWMEKVVFPAWYMNLARSMRERQTKYRKLFDAYLREEGLIQRCYTKYGMGSVSWVLQQRERVLDILRAQRALNRAQAPP